MQLYFKSSPSIDTTENMQEQNHKLVGKEFTIIKMYLESTHMNKIPTY